MKTEILVKRNWNWNTCLIEIEIETEIHCKTIIETELKYITNNEIEIETEIYLITDTTLMLCQFFGWLTKEFFVEKSNCQQKDMKRCKKICLIFFFGGYIYNFVCKDWI